MSFELTYTQVGDYLLPSLTLEPQPNRDLGKYGRMRRRYFKEYCLGLYNRLVLSGKLFDHLLEIEDAANTLLDQMMPNMEKAAGATEELKTLQRSREYGI